MEEVYARLGVSFRTLFDAALDAVIISDEAGIVVEANPAAVELFGVAHDELVGTSTARFLGGIDMSALRERFEREGQLRVEVDIVRPDGSHRAVESVARANFVPGRNLSILRDITDRRVAEAARRQADERFSKAFRSSPAPIAILRASDGRYVDVNDAFLALADRPREAVIGRTSFEAGILGPGARERILAKVDRNGAARNVEVDVLRPSGEVRHVLSSTEPMELDGELCQIAVVNDVTDARRAELARRADAARFRALVEHSTDIFLLVDGEGLIRYVSPAFTRILGYPVEAWIGRSAIDLAGPEHVEAQHARLVDALERPGAVRRGLLTAKHADGRSVHFESTSVTRLDDPDVGAIVVNLRDVSERERTQAELRKIEEQLRHSQKMEAIGSLAGGVAHDFNNLLSIILGYLSIALEELGPAEHLRPELEEIEGAAKRAAELTRQLLAFSRRQVLEPRSLDLNELIQGLQKLLRRLVGESIEITTQLTSPLGSVMMDPGQFEQAIVNIAANARDAMPTGGQILIETANVELDAAYAAMHEGVAPGPFVLVAVSDTGAGMTAATRARIFEPFFTTKELGKGTGLGLATVFGIVKQHGGHVWVYSEVGHGTTFKLYFPRTDRPPESARFVESAIGARPGGFETILLVEDDDGVRGLVKTILRREGYNVLEASSPGEALITCEQFQAKIHLLLTDVIMPKMSGRVLAERLAVLKPGMRVLYMSGYTDDAIVHHGVLDAGVAFLQKPITPNALSRKVRQVLDGAAPDDRG
jgi:two-component system, cell cycle sensor histidine kinase and response regulator CckA